MNIVFIVLAVGTALTFLAGSVQGLIAWYSADTQVQRKLRPSIIVCILLSIVLVGASYYSLSPTPSTPGTSAHSSSSPSPISSLTATTTLTSSTSSLSSSPTATSTPIPISNDYSVAQPGAGCDTGKGTWTSQGLNAFACGQQIIPVSTGVWGYLFLQLPSNEAFSADNQIIVSASTFDGRWVACIGLAEIGAGTGYLATYCGNGTWSVYKISNNGILIQQLKNSVTALRTSTTISLTLNRNTLLFTIDTEHYQVPISPIQPTKVAIGIDKIPSCDNCGIIPSNFSYLTHAS